MRRTRGTEKKKGKPTGRKKGEVFVNSRMRRTKHSEKSSIRKELDRFANGSQREDWYGKRSAPPETEKAKRHRHFSCALRMIQCFGWSPWMSSIDVRSRWGHCIIPGGRVLNKKGKDVTHRCLDWPVTKEKLLNKKTTKGKVADGKKTAETDRTIKRTR